MHIAICMADGMNFRKFIDCIEKAQAQYPCQWDCYHNPLDCLENFMPGRYDALFFDELLTPSNVAELTQTDGQLRLVKLVTDDDDSSALDGMWSFLSNPPKPLFVRSLLAHLQEETTIQDGRSIAIKARGKLLRIAFDHIEYVEALGRSIIFHLTDGKEEEVIGTLSAYADRLLELPDFVRTHRSYLVNLRCVQKLTRDGIHTVTGAFVPVAVNGYTQFKKDYMKSMMLLPDIEKAAPAPPPPQTVPRILLVDDDPVELERWGTVLTQHGCIVATATNEESAVCLLNKHRYDCVILDVQLGRNSGFDLHQRIKPLTHAPILYLSTLNDFEHQARGFQSGGVDYITKNVSGELFWLKVQSRIQASTTPMMAISSGQLELQLSTRGATFLGKPLPLTVVEFNLLHLFVQNPNTVYAPTELYRRIWGKDTSDSDQVIQLHLSSLSEKLNRASPHHRYIRAVWGKGYCFAPDDKEGI